MCSMDLIRMDLEVSPSYTFVVFLLFSHVLQIHLYPVLFVLHGTLKLPYSPWHRGHPLASHFSFLKGFLFVNNFSILIPPFSTILILSCLFLFNSCSLFLNSLRRPLPGVGGTKSILVYTFSDLSTLLYQFFLLFSVNRTSLSKVLC